MFVKHFDNEFLVVLVYVDDILISSTDDELVSELKAQLNLAFKLCVLGILQIFFLALRLLDLKKGSLFAKRSMS